MISTDTTNHLPYEEKAAILANGLPLISYSPTAISERQTNTNRITYWDGGKLLTKVNGGGNFVDIISNSSADIEVIDCPDGDIMLVYLDVFRDPIDITHAFVAETPFAKVARYSREYDMFRDVARPRPLSPYTITRDDGMTYSCLSVRHNDLIQIVDNTARLTRYYHRSELLALSGMVPSFRAQRRLRENPPTIFEEEQDDLHRYEILTRIGFNNLVSICKSCPEMNIPQPTEMGTHSHAINLIFTASLRDQQGFDRRLAEADPEARELALEILRKYKMRSVRLPSVDSDATGYHSVQTDPG